MPGCEFCIRRRRHIGRLHSDGQVDRLKRVYHRSVRNGHTLRACTAYQREGVCQIQVCGVALGAV